jgi:hypothetical protein
VHWQACNGLGVVLGYAADLIFYNDSVAAHAPAGNGLRWRLMVGAAALPALIVCIGVYAGAKICPESPRWYLGRGRHADAYAAMRRLRFSRVQAVRDLFALHALIEAEAAAAEGAGEHRRANACVRGGMRALLTGPTNRRATLAMGVLVFMQQVRPVP